VNGSSGHQAVPEHVDSEGDRVDADLRAGRRDIDAQRLEQVVAEEAAAVPRLPRPLPQRQLQRGQRAVGTGEVDAEDRQGDWRVDQQQSRPAQGDQRAGQHEQDGEAVHHTDRLRQQHT
jgi:hypothetical protein